MRSATNQTCGDLSGVALTSADQCGAYQIDSYIYGSDTDALVAKGTLTKGEDTALLENNPGTTAYTSTDFSTNCATTPPCITALWKIPGGNTSDAFAQPQTLVKAAAAKCGDLTPPTTIDKCTAYQVDSYDNTPATTAFLAPGILNHSGDDSAYLEKSSGTTPYTTIAITGTNCNPTALKTQPGVQFKDVCGTTGDSYTTTLADHIAYAVKDNRTNGVGTVVVTATADAGYTFLDADGKTAVSTETFPAITFTDTACTTPVTTQPAVSFDEQCGTVNDTYTTSPADHITYAVTNDARVNGAGTLTITATAASGYTFASPKDGTAVTTAEYSHTYTNEACAVTPPVVPPVTPPVVSPPTVTPATTVTKVDAPSVTPEKTASTTKTVAPTVEAPSVLASTGMNDSTPIAGSIALFALLFGALIVAASVRHRRKTSGE